MTRNVLLTGGATVALIGVFGPWLRSGSALRSSFELFDLAERLGFASSGLFAWAVRPWPFVPILVVVTVAAGWSGRAIVCAVTGIVVSTYVIAVAVSVTLAPDVGLIEVEWGVQVSIAGGLVVLATSCWTAAAQRSA